VLLGNAIKSAKKVVCFLTKKYIDSHNCRLEIQFAYALRKPIIICMLERIPIAEIEHGIGLIIA